MQFIKDNEKLIHICTEIIVLIVVCFFFARKNAKTLKFLQDISVKVDEQEEQIKQLHAKLNEKLLNDNSKPLFDQPSSQAPSFQSDDKQKSVVAEEASINRLREQEHALQQQQQALQQQQRQQALQQQQQQQALQQQQQQREYEMHQQQQDLLRQKELFDLERATTNQVSEKPIPQQTLNETTNDKRRMQQENEIKERDDIMESMKSKVKSSAVNQTASDMRSDRRDNKSIGVESTSKDVEILEEINIEDELRSELADLS